MLFYKYISNSIRHNKTTEKIMKTIRLYLIALCYLTLIGQAHGQQERGKLRNDPTYSTRNYKHANKAATARKWETNSGVAVQPPVSGQSNVANYKRQSPNQTPVGGVTVNHTPSTDVVDRNYKIQRPNQSTGYPNASLAGKNKKRNRPDSTTAVGD